MGEREQLFRPGMLAQQSRGNSGIPLWQQDMRAGVFVAVSTVLVLGALLLLGITDYRETTSARGILMPVNGAHRVVAPTAATVTRIAVSAGDKVRKGQVLAAISKSTYDQQGRTIQQEEIAQLHSRRTILEQKHELDTRRYQQSIQQVIDVIFQLQESYVLIDAEIELLEKQLELAETNLNAATELHNGHAISRAQFEQAQGRHLSAQFHLQEALLRRQKIAQEVTAQQARQENLALDSAQARLLARQDLEELGVRINQLINTFHQTVIAEYDGVVATVTVQQGQAVRALEPLVYIHSLPNLLQAVVYVPSRVLGTMYPGQGLLLAYDAFEPQHFGRYHATVTSLDHASLDPREHLLPIDGIREPAFRVTATLEQAYVEGADIYRLQAGLLFTADIVHAEMSLLEYIFKPVLKWRTRIA